MQSERMPKTKRWAFRVASEPDHIVRHAASTANTTRTDFVVDAAVTEASQVPGRDSAVTGEGRDRAGVNTGRPLRDLTTGRGITEVCTARACATFVTRMNR